MSKSEKRNEGKKKFCKISGDREDEMGLGERRRKATKGGVREQ